MEEGHPGSLPPWRLQVSLEPEPGLVHDPPPVRETWEGGEGDAEGWDSRRKVGSCLPYSSLSPPKWARSPHTWDPFAIQRGTRPEEPVPKSRDGELGEVFLSQASQPDGQNLKIKC